MSVNGSRPESAVNDRRCTVCLEPVLFSSQSKRISTHYRTSKQKGLVRRLLRLLMDWKRGVLRNFTSINELLCGESLPRLIFVAEHWWLRGPGLIIDMLVFYFIASAVIMASIPRIGTRGGTRHLLDEPIRIIIQQEEVYKAAGGYGKNKNKKKPNIKRYITCCVCSSSEAFCNGWLDIIKILKVQEWM